MPHWSLYLGAIASFATAVGVLFAGWQLYAAKKQATTSFEDSLAREYRAIAQRLPVKALLGDPMTPNEMDRSFQDFYHYIDLSNEQIFLRQNRRVSRAAWLNWSDGIEALLRKPAFCAAWMTIKTKAPDSFEELRRLEREGFRSDPICWSRSRSWKVACLLSARNKSRSDVREPYSSTTGDIIQTGLGMGEGPTMRGG